MQLTDNELWHILQVEPAAEPLPWERDAKPVPGTVWIEWAKTEILSGAGAVSKSGIFLEQCSVYLARLVRVLDILTEYGFDQANRHMKDGVVVYEEDYLNTLLVNGLEACECSSGKTEIAISLAKRDGFLVEREVDTWHPGMPSGSGMRTCYGLTFKGKNQAKKASVMPPVCEVASVETPKAESAESPEHTPSKDNGGEPPSTSEQLPDIPPEDWQNAGLIVLLLLAQAYYKLLESAVRNLCGAVDLELNGKYLWAVNNLTNLLKNHHGLADFPGTFEPCLKDLMPSSIVDVDWDDMVAPEAECFLSTVQQYVMTKGTYPPEEGTAAWIFVETFKSSVNEAIQVGETYSKRMRHEFKAFMGRVKPNTPGASDTPVTPKTVTKETPKAVPPSAPEHTDPKATQPSRAPRTDIPRTQRSILAGFTVYTGVPLAHIVNDLRDWEQSTKQSCAFLREKLDVLKKAQESIPQDHYDQKFETDMIEWERRVEETKMSPEMMHLTKPFLAKYSDIEGFIVATTTVYERFVLEFARLIQELPRGVKESHAEALRQILQHCERIDDRCRDFREDYVIRGPWSEIAESVYYEIREIHGNFMDLGNVALRLHALVGSTLESVGKGPNIQIPNGQEDGYRRSENGWAGLQVGEVFEPRVMMWNGQPFTIEESAQCYRGYDLEEQSLEDYFPDLHDDWDRYIKEVPFEEVQNLRVLRLVGYEHTLMIHVMLKDSVAVYPDQLESSAATKGWHEGGVVLVAGQKFPIKGVRVESTDVKAQAMIAANRRGRKPIAMTPVASEGVTATPDKTITLEAIHAGICQLHEIAKPLPVAIAQVKKDVEVVQKHVRNVPVLQAELAEARINPEAMALEIQNKIADILEPEEQVIWRAVRKAGGRQKNALPFLQESKTVNSTATLSRRVKEIDKKLRESGLPPCSSSGPSVRFTKSGGHQDDKGKTAPEEISPADRDWAESPDSRDSTIRLYLAAPAEDKGLFHQTYFGIEDEAKEYQKRCGMKSG
jgi:hypothetical protein